MIEITFEYFLPDKGTPGTVITIQLGEPLMVKAGSLSSGGGKFTNSMTGTVIPASDIGIPDPTNYTLFTITVPDSIDPGEYHFSLSLYCSEPELDGYILHTSETFTVLDKVVNPSITTITPSTCSALELKTKTFILKGQVLSKLDASQGTFLIPGYIKGQIRIIDDTTCYARFPYTVKSNTYYLLAYTSVKTEVRSLSGIQVLP